MARTGEGYERLLDEPAQGSGADSPAVQAPPPSPIRAFVPMARGQSAKTSDSAALTGAGGGAYSLTASATAAAPAPPAQQVATAAAAVDPELAALEAAPDAVAELEEASNLITIWMGMAVGTLILSFLEFSMGSLAAVVGIAGAVPHVLSCCRTSLAEAVKTTHVLAMVAAFFSSIATIMAASLCLGLSTRCDDVLSEEQEEGCESLVELFFFYMLWYLLYAALSAWIARTASRLRRLLNPITNGVVSVGA